MQLRTPHAQIPNPLAVLRKAGYSPFRDPNTQEESWIIRLGPDFYPRLHLYIEERRDEVVFNFHLDQKQPSYGHNHRHNGEYDGPLLEREKIRLAGWIQATLHEN